MAVSKKLAKLARDPNKFFEDYFAKRRRRSSQKSNPRLEAIRTFIESRMRVPERPIDDNLVVYESFNGASIACNPLAIFEGLRRDPRFAHLRHAWIVRDPQLHSQAFASMSNVELVRRGTDRHKRVVQTARYLVNNNTFDAWFSKRDGQVYVNTQHGVPIKTLGRDAIGTFALGANVTRNLLHTDFLVMPNRFTTDRILAAHDVQNLFAGEVIEAGYPRFDLTLRAVDNVDRLRERLGIMSGKKVILYAPTYRGSHARADDQSEHIASLKAAIERRFSGDYVFLCRAHHTVLSRDEGDRFAEAVNAMDANALLAVVDVLITDYSSIAFDFVPLNRPIIYYAYDVEEYKRTRGTYLELDELPGAICGTIEDVERELEGIETFIERHGPKYREALDRFCANDDGGATKRVIERVFCGTGAAHTYTLKPDHRRRVLVYGGGFFNNGVTSSVASMLKSIDSSQFDVYLAFNGRATEESFTRLRARAPAETKFVYYLPSKGVNFTSEQERGQHEARRIFGHARFDVAIDASGYGRLWPSMIASVDATRRAIFLHNCMKSERESRPELADYDYLFHLYDVAYDLLVNVSESSYTANVEFLPHLRDKMVYTENILDAERVRDLSRENVVDERKTNFINIGRYSYQKGQDRLLEAFARVHADHPETHLYIVGHGPDEKALRTQVRRLGLSEAVHITGKMENPFPLLKACDCFVMSSRYEGQGIVLLESLTLGITTISTDIPGPRSILDDAFLVEDSVDGLVSGMKRFMDGSLPEQTFDVERYNAAARRRLEAVLA
ncbi:MAG: glycosyltransferase [Polyangiales bacterium]